MKHFQTLNLNNAYIHFDLESSFYVYIKSFRTSMTKYGIKKIKFPVENKKIMS